jgi:uncharacterized protein YecT (DUF1311 family)
MKRITRFYPILFLLIGSLLAVANPGDADNLDQHQLNEKSVRDYQKVQATLDKVYHEALTVAHDKATKEKIIASQKAWIIYRDSVLNIYASDGGSGRIQFSNLDAIALAEERIKVLTPGYIY